MRKIMLSQLLADDALPFSLPAIELTGITDDTRRLLPGECQIITVTDPVRIEKMMAEAISRKAAVIIKNAEIPSIETINAVTIISLANVRERLGHWAAIYYQHPAQKMRMIGITGTNGKTSISHYTARAFKQAGIRCGVIGTIGNGWPDELQASPFTTPTPILLQKIIATLKQEGAQAVAMEVSSHALEQGRVNSLPFDVAVFTNLTRDHLDYHQTMAAYGEAKMRLFRWPHLRHAIVNLDDPFTVEILKNVSPTVSVIGYSTENNSILNSELVLPFCDYQEIQASQLTLHQSHLQAQVTSPWGQGCLKTQLIGRFNLSNLLAVMAILGDAGIEFTHILSLLASLSPVPGRLQLIQKTKRPRAIVDYSHTPDALAKTLMVLREYCHGKIWCVFGCGGDRDTGKRPLMAEIAERYADHVIVTDDNPRTENPEEIFQDIFKGFASAHRIVAQHDRAMAIRYALTNAHEQDIVLIAGKGHETYQIIGQQTLEFSDVAFVESVFAE